jgi:hypothetical protein
MDMTPVMNKAQSYLRYLRWGAKGASVLRVLKVLVLGVLKVLVLGVLKVLVLTVLKVLRVPAAEAAEGA